MRVLTPPAGAQSTTSITRACFWRARMNVEESTATVWIRVAIAAQLLMLIYFTVDNHIDLYPWNNLRGPRAELPSTHDDFTWHHDHGYAETLKVLAPIGERRRGIAGYVAGRHSGRA